MLKRVLRVLINTSIGVGDRPYILLIGSDCNLDNAVKKDAVESINEYGRYTDAVYVENQEQLVAALNDTKIVNVYVEKDIVISQKLSVAPIPESEEERVVKINGNGHTIKYDGSYNSTILEVPERVSVNFNDVVIDGDNHWYLGEDADGDSWYDNYIVSSGGAEVSNYIFKNSGTLSLGSGVVIKDIVFNSGNSNYNGDIGVIYSSGGTLNLDGVSLDNCAGLFVNAVSTEVKITGNTVVSNNFGYGNKGGMFIINNSTATIDGNAKINNNRSVVRSGAIFGLVNNSTLIMNGGQINNNVIETYGSNTAGAMIVIESGSGMVMNGGEINGNTGALAGAIASRWNSGSYGTSDGIFLNGGTIKDNTSIGSSWNNASVFLRSKGSIGANMVIDGIVSVNSDGVLDNAGTINGNLFVTHTSAVVNNSGTINGNVNVTVATATFNNTGTVNGTITRP